MILFQSPVVFGMVGSLFVSKSLIFFLRPMRNTHDCGHISFGLLVCGGGEGQDVQGFFDLSDLYFLYNKLIIEIKKVPCG